MTKKVTFKIINMLLVIGWMLMVFMLSSEGSYESSKTSSFVTKWLIELLHPNMDGKLVKLLDPMIRKLAHLTLYGIGGFLITNLIELYKEKIQYTEIISLLIGIFYAISDEFHQLFVSGRSCEIMDVGIDTMGFIIGLCIMCAVIKVRGNLSDKKENYKKENMDI